MDPTKSCQSAPLLVGEGFVEVEQEDKRMAGAVKVARGRVFIDREGIGAGEEIKIACESKREVARRGKLIRISLRRIFPKSLLCLGFA